MLARLVYAIHLGLALLGITLGASAIASGRLDLVAQSILCFALGASLRWRLRRANRLDACEQSLDNLFCDPSADGETDDPELAALLERRASLEELRGSPRFDPWEFLSVQHDIEAHLRAHPQSKADGMRHEP